MAFVKTKKILIDTDFSRDKYFPENSLFKTMNRTSFPTTSADVQLQANQPVHFSINNILNRLLDNDKFISQYLDVASSSNVDRDKLTATFQTTVTEVTANAYETELVEHMHDYHEDIPEALQFETLDRDYLKTDMSNFDLDSAKHHVLSGDHDTTVTLTSIIDGHEYTSGSVQCSADIIVDIEFNDSSTKSQSYVQVNVANHKTGNVFRHELPLSEAGAVLNEMPSLAEVPYIFRRWLSGMKEFFIYLPTTFTFYNEFYGRPGKHNTSKNLNGRATFIQLRLNKRHFNLSHIYSAHICGESLPLQIHAGEDPFYSDIAQPSMVRTLPISQDPDDNMDTVFSENTNFFELYFTCYGTDAQAIRIVCD